MYEVLKIHRDHPIKIQIPSNSDKFLNVTIQDIKESDDQTYIIIYIKTDDINKFSYLTNNIIEYFIKVNLERHLKLFSIEKDFEACFI